MIQPREWILRKARMVKRIKAAGQWDAFVAARDRYRREYPDETNVEVIYTACYDAVMTDAEIVVW